MRDSADVQRQGTAMIPKRPKVSGATKMVSFAPEFTLHLGFESSSNWSTTIFPEDARHALPGKPWALREDDWTSDEDDADLCDPLFLSEAALISVNELRTTDQHGRPEHLPADDVAGGVNPVDIPRGNDQDGELPYFVHAMLRVTEADVLARAENRDWGFTVRTWYLHHRLYRRCAVSRNVQLTGPPQGWFGLILATWHDLVQRAEEVDVSFVQPAPPRSWYERYVVHDLMLTQGIHEERLPSLVTIAPTVAEMGLQMHAIALSFEYVISSSDLLRRAGIREWCARRHFQIIHGHDVIDNDEPFIEIEAGDSFVVYVGKERSSASGAAGCDNAAVSNAGNGDQASSDHDVDMADTPPDADSSDGYSPSVNEDVDQQGETQDEEDEDRQRVIIYRLNHPSTTAFLRWRSFEQIYFDTARALWIDPIFLTTVHFLAVKPVGEQPNEESIIAQHVNDIPVGSSEQLVLVDVVFHVLSSCDVTQPATLHDRRVIKILPLVGRIHFLQYFQLENYCVAHGDRCVVQVNNQVWNFQDAGLRHLAHGTYVRIEVPPSPGEHKHLLEVIADLEESVGMRHRFELLFGAICPNVIHDLDRDLERAQNADLDLNTMDYFWSEFKLADSHQVTGPEFVRNHHEPVQQANLPPVANAAPFIEQLEASFRAGACTEVEEEGPVGYYITWFVHHHTQRKCLTSRTVRLGTNRAMWLPDLCDAWRDVMSPTETFGAYLVLPDPPRSQFQHHIGHIVIEQHLLPDRVAVLASALFQGLFEDSSIQIALSLPREVRGRDVLQTLEILPYCLRRPCFIWSGRQHYRINSFKTLHSGQGLCVHLLPRLETDAPGDHSEGDVEVPETSSSCIQPPLPRFEGTLRLRDPTAFADELARLRAAWNAAAEQPPIRCSLMTWYVDHQRLPRNPDGRALDLPEDPGSWERALRDLWRDWILPDVELHIAVVIPQPPGGEPDLCAHVILSQQEPIGDASVLVTFAGPFDDHWHPHHVAVAVPGVVDHWLLITVAGLLQDCPPFQPGNICRSWFGEIDLTPGQLQLAQTGFGFTVFVSRPLALTTSSIELHDWHTRASGALGSLQAAITTAICNHHATVCAVEDPLEASCMNAAQSPACQKIDFSAVIDAFETHIDSHFLLPKFDFALSDTCHPVAPWLAHWWTPELGGQELWIYYDGSFTPGNEHLLQKESAGAAVAAFVKVSDDWFFAGALNAHLPFGDSYVAELCSAAVALKFTHDLLKLFLVWNHAMPVVHHCSDSQTVGRQAAGDWQLNSEPTKGSLVRSLSQLVEHRFGLQIQNWHIRGHSGDPGNEFVDMLARDGSDKPELGSFAPWLITVMTPAFAAHAEWFWLLFDWTYAQFWSGTLLALPLPTTQPDAAVLDALQCEEESPHALEIADVRIIIFSCNVLSLKSSSSQIEKVVGIEGPARQAALLRQLHDQKCVLFGFQETRLRKLHASVDEHYLLYKSAATSNGQGGIMAGLSKVLPYGTVPCGNQKGRKLFFRDDHIGVVFGDSRTLILRINAPFFKCIFVVAHAPHSGQPNDVVDMWWRDLWQRVPSCYQSWPAQLFLPATFEDFHVGPGETWTHSGGRQRRIDFVGISLQWSLTHCLSTVVTDFDPAFLRSDHDAVSVEVAWQTKGTLPFRHRRRSLESIQLDDVGDLFGHVSHNMPFHMDVHSHADHLQRALEKTLSKATCTQMPRPLKTTMTDETWTIVCAKRACRSQLAEANRLQRRAYLEMAFTAWKHRQGHHLQLFAQLLRQQDHTIAILLYNFRSLGRVATSALRNDDRAFFDNLLQEGADFLHPKQVRQLWQTIRRSIPKFKSRRAGLAPQKIVALEHDWIPYLAELEVGTITAPKDLLQLCVEGQASRLTTAPEEVDLGELPSLQRFETALRKTQPGRATGLDSIPSAIFHAFPKQCAKIFYPLALKIFLWGTEPAQYKGGRMAMIPKKQDLSTVANFRGILLLPTLAKRLHALVREQLIKAFLPARDEGQLGGLPEQQVLFGSQAIRVATSILASFGWSVGVLFIDLSNAFHRLISEWITGVHDLTDFQVVIDALHSAGCPVDFGRRVDEFKGLLRKMPCSQILCRLLDDIHIGTWFTLFSGEVVRTRRGTRPGSPLADAVFHVLMGAITCSLRQWISERLDFLQLLGTAGIEIPIVVWSDDLAVVWATDTAQALPAALEQVMQFIDGKFKEYGFDINYSKGKTEAVVTFRGTGAPELRKRYVLSDKPGIPVQMDDTRSEWLHFSPSYKHLGTMYATTHTLEQELRHRIGAAKGAFGQLARSVVCNRHFPRPLRLRLFHALVGSRLFFGLGAWATPPPRLMQKLRVTYLGMLRKVLKLPKDEFASHKQVLIEAEAGDVRARLAMDRLAYARRVFQCGPAFLQTLLFREHEVHADSWLHGLFADLQWLCDLMPGDLPEGCTVDLTELIHLWQMPTFPWKRLLRKAWRKYLAQEKMMFAIDEMHKGVYRTLVAAGAHFSTDPEWLHRDRREAVHSCHCGRQFTTPQGLALHKWKMHDEHAPEHCMVDGPVCPACLQFLWSSNRVRMHLTYMPRDGSPNLCYQYLQSIGYVSTPSNVRIPPHLRGAVRLDALCAEGPLHSAPHRLEAELREVQRQIDACSVDLVYGPRPPDEIQEGALLGAALTRCTRMWCRKFREHHDLTCMPSLMDWWLGLITSYGRDLDDWAEMVFLLWGKHELEGIVEERIDGEVESILDELFAEMVELLPRPTAESQLAFLKAKQQRLREERDRPAAPHRPVQRGTANASERRLTGQQVPHAFEEQGDWLACLRDVRWLTFPEDKKIPVFVDAMGRKTILVAHLFSGRRRVGDLHFQLHEWSRRSGIGVIVLSYDTAVSTYYGNLDHRSDAWRGLCRVYEAGWVACTLLGTPCETFSEARFQEPPPGQRWPRPLRSDSRIYGLPGLTNRELRQVSVGSCFYLQGLQVLAYHIVTGGYYISEHPAPPVLPERPSVWRAPLTLLLRQHPATRLNIINQWEWHAEAVKPTGLLSLGLPSLVRSMRSVPNLETQRPTTITVGKGPDGRFRTACLKEYPAKLSEALARSFTDQLTKDLRCGHWRRIEMPADDAELWSWVQATAEAGMQNSVLTSWLPDFQG